MHELTKLLFDKFYSLKDCDEVITSYLKKKAEELANKIFYADTKKILGLKDAECEHSQMVSCLNCLNKKGMSAPAVKEECICKTVKPGECLAILLPSLQPLCAICREEIKPRPAESKRSLAEILYDVWNTGIRTYWKDASFAMKADWRNVSDTAKAHFLAVIESCVTRHNSSPNPDPVEGVISKTELKRKVADL